MTNPVLPTVAALLSSDDTLLEQELRLAAVRRQAAVVRALMDEVERFHSTPGRATLAQMADEMARLARSVQPAKVRSAAAPESARSAPRRD